MKTTKAVLNSFRMNDLVKGQNIDTKYHFAREPYKAKDINVQNCPTDEISADMLTKQVEAVKLRHLLCYCSNLIFHC